MENCKHGTSHNVECTQCLTDSPLLLEFEKGKKFDILDPFEHQQLDMMFEKIGIVDIED